MEGWGREKQRGPGVLNILLVVAFIPERPVSHEHFLAPVSLTRIQNDAFMYADFYTSALTAYIMVI